MNPGRVTVGMYHVVRRLARQKSSVPPRGPPAYSNEALVRLPRDAIKGLSRLEWNTNGRIELVTRRPFVRKSAWNSGDEMLPSELLTLPISMIS